VVDAQPRVLSFDPDLPELARVTASHMTLPPKAKICRAVGVIEIVLGGWLVATASGTASAAIGGAAVMFGALLLRSFTQMGRRRALRTAIRRTPALAEHQEVTADPTGLRVRARTSELWFGWSRYQTVASDDLGVALVLRGGAGVRFVPRRAFADAAEQSAWAHQLGSWVEEAVRSAGS